MAQATVQATAASLDRRAQERLQHVRFGQAPSAAAGTHLTRDTQGADGRVCPGLRHKARISDTAHNLLREGASAATAH